MRAVVGVGAAPSRKVCVEVVCGSGVWEWDQMTTRISTLCQCSKFKKQNGRRVQLAVGELSRK